VNTPILDILHIPLTAIRGVSPYDFLSRHETPVNDLASDLHDHLLAWNLLLSRLPSAAAARG